MAVSEVDHVFQLSWGPGKTVYTRTDDRVHGTRPDIFRWLFAALTDPERLAAAGATGLVSTLAEVLDLVG